METTPIDFKADAQATGAGESESVLRDSVPIEALIASLLAQTDPVPGRPGLSDTPKRFARMWDELTRGYRETPESVVGSGMFPAEFSGIVRVEKIPFYSLCEHHLVPFFGTVSVEYKPRERILGLSKFSRVVNIFALRLQVQERMTQEILNAFRTLLEPESLSVSIRARHLCKEMRGVKVRGCWTVTEANWSQEERSGNA